jgi:hypothetical protein
MTSASRWSSSRVAQTCQRASVTCRRRLIYSLRPEPRLLLVSACSSSSSSPSTGETLLFTNNLTWTDPQTAPLTLAKLQDPFKKSLDTTQKDLKPIYSGLNKYGKVLDKVATIPISSSSSSSSSSTTIMLPLPSFCYYCYYYTHTHTHTHTRTDKMLPEIQRQASAIRRK